MATVVMRRGALFADIFDSPETIGQARKEGWRLCSEADLTVREEDRGRRGRRGKPKEEDSGGRAEPDSGGADESAEEEPKPDEAPKKKRGVFGV